MHACRGSYINKHIQDRVKISIKIEEYLKRLQLEQLFSRLTRASSPEILAEETQHFTDKEAAKRDKIVVGYFGQNGVNRIVDTIAKLLLASNLPSKAKMLDAGAGSGLFTIKIARKICANLPIVSMYAMDLTPAMLVSLIRKRASLTPFIGMAENIKDNIMKARKFKIPYKFDIIFSTNASP